MKIAKLGIVLLVMVLFGAVSVFAQPAVDAIADKTVDEGKLLSFSVTSSASDNPSADTPVKFRFCDATSNPVCSLSTPTAGASDITIGSTKANLTNTSKTSAQFNWTPSVTQEGTYKFNVSAEDGNSQDSKLFTVTVKDIAPTLSAPASLVIGGASQKRSNPRHDDAKDKEINVTASFTITNSGSEQLTGIAASVALGAEASSASKGGGVTLADVRNKVTVDKTSLNAGESATVTVEMRIPEKLSAVDSKGKPKAWNVADIAVSGTRTQSGHTSDKVTSTVKVTMQAENSLTLEDSKIAFDGKSENLDDGDEIDDVKPGDNTRLDFEVENQFKDEEDVSIDNIELTVENDDDLDVDEEEEVNELDPEDKDTVVVEFTVDEDTPKGDQELDILLIGEDAHGAVHGEAWKITLKVEREDHEIDIRSMALSPSTVACEAETTLNVEVRNTGRRDEDDVFVRVSAPELKFSKVGDELQLDEDDETTQTFTIPIASDTKPGTYRVSVETYYDTNKKSQTDGVILTKDACQPEAPAEEKKEESPVVVVPTPKDEQPEEKPPVVVQPPVSEEKKDFFQGKGFIALLILGYIVVLGGGIAIAVKLLKK